MKREPFSLQDAWQNVGDLYATIVALFGEPLEIATRLLLMRENRRDILSWLGPLEALARRLLLLKALTMPTPNDAPQKGATGRVIIAFTDRVIENIHPEPAQWRVHFNVMPKGALRRKPRRESDAEARPDRRGGDINFNALPLARRLEALRRVLENPAPAVARLCRLIATRRAAVEAAFRTYRPPANAVQTSLIEAQRELDLALNTS